MQSPKESGLHIVDTADIAHNLKFNNLNEPVQWDISKIFYNPLHIVTIVISIIIIII